MQPCDGYHFKIHHISIKNLLREKNLQYLLRHLFSVPVGSSSERRPQPFSDEQESLQIKQLYLQSKIQMFQNKIMSGVTCALTTHDH